MRDALPAGSERARIGVAGVMVEDAARQQLLGIFALEVVQAAVRRVAMECAVVRDQFTGVGELRQLLRNRPRIAGPDDASTQAQPERGVGPVVTNGERFQAQAVVPEGIGDRDQHERVPEIGASLGHDVRVAGDALLQQRHQGSGNVQARAGGARRCEIVRAEQPLEAADVVEVGVGDEQRLRPAPVMREIRGQSFVAAVDGQPGMAVAFDGRHRRTQFDRARIADPMEAQRPVHVSSHVPRLLRKRCEGARNRASRAPVHARRAASATNA